MSSNQDSGVPFTGNASTSNLSSGQSSSGTQNTPDATSRKRRYIFSTKSPTTAAITDILAGVSNFVAEAIKISTCDDLKKTQAIFDAIVMYIGIITVARNFIQTKVKRLESSSGQSAGSAGVMQTYWSPKRQKRSDSTEDNLKTNFDFATHFQIVSLTCDKLPKLKQLLLAAKQGIAGLTIQRDLLQKKIEELQNGNQNTSRTSNPGNAQNTSGSSSSSPSSDKSVHLTEDHPKFNDFVKVVKKINNYKAIREALDNLEAFEKDGKN